MAKKKFTLWAAALALALPLLFTGYAYAIHASDGTKPNGVTGGWDITDFGRCIAGIDSTGVMVTDTAHNASRPDCIDHTYPVYTTAATCTATGRANGDDLSHYWGSVCVDASGNGINLNGLDRTATNCALKGGTMQNACMGSWIYTGPNNDGAPGFCYTSINLTTAYGTASACPTTTNGYAWTSSQCRYSYGITGYTTAVVNKKDGTGSVPAGTFVDLSGYTQGQCLLNGFSWSTGTVKSGNATAATTPNQSTIGVVTNTRAGCLECHNSVSQYNTYAERWKEPYMMTGHKNMLRKVTAGQNWAGPDGQIYTAYAAGTLDFANATAQVGGVDKPLLYIFGDWMAPAPAGLDVIVDMGTPTGAKYNGTGNYSCAPCHTSGWNNPSAGICVVGAVAKPTSGTGSVTTESACTTAGGTWYPMNGIEGASYTPAEPAASFPGITFTGAGRWDRDGIQCSRCHYALFAQTGTNAPGTPFAAPPGTSAHNVTPATSANQQVNNICFGCHQSIGKVNNGTGTDSDLGNPALNITTTATEFSSHPITNMFLNSPHANYSAPASGNSIMPNNLGKFDLVGNAASQYNSAFKGFVCRSSSNPGGGSILAEVLKNGVPTRITTLTDCQLANSTIVGGVPTPTTSTGVWQTENQGACTTCHDVHQSLFDPGATEPLKKECQTCHMDTTGPGGTGYAALLPSKQIDLSKMIHPSGAGTPFDKMLFANSCEVCHMPKATDAGFPNHLWRISTSAGYSTFPTATQVSSNIKKNANVDANGKIWIDLDLACGQCHGGSKGAGAVKYGAYYRSKTYLAARANGMHNDGIGAPGAENQAPAANGGYSVSSYTVTFTDASTDPDGPLPANAITINWGDGSVSTGNQGGIFTHGYTRATTAKITLTATDGLLFNSKSFTVSVPQKFTVSGTCPQNTVVTLKKAGRTVQVQKATQTAGGSYLFSNVLPGTNYTITAYKRGLKFAVTPLVVDADKTVDITPLP